LFTHPVTVNTALDIRRWEYDLNLKGTQNLDEARAVIIKTVSRVEGVLSDPGPEVLVLDLSDLDSNAAKVASPVVDESSPPA